jgi:hypothetical protein
MKYHCEECNQDFKLKKFFIEHLKEHYEEATQIIDYVAIELEDLGVTQYQ